MKGDRRPVSRVRQRRLPPLNALRAFEASARHLSFSRAAEELGVTPAAISHQVRLLEQHLHVPLFRRLTRTVLLTDAGQACLPALQDGFDRLAEAVAILRSVERNRVLTVSVPPSFARRWLLPRIERFTEAHPEFDVRISANLALVDFRADHIDLAIRYGVGDYAGLRAERLFNECMTPMCSPALMRQGGPLETPSDLRNHTLIHDDTAYVSGPTPDWRMWLWLAGATDVDWSRGLRFGRAEDAMRAALDGLGVVLGRPTRADADLAAGRLVCPFKLVLPCEFGYHLVRPQVGNGRPAVAVFRKWLLDEARRDEVGLEQAMADQEAR